MQITAYVAFIQLAWPGFQILTNSMTSYKKLMQVWFKILVLNYIHYNIVFTAVHKSQMVNPDKVG